MILPAPGDDVAQRVVLAGGPAPRAPFAMTRARLKLALMAAMLAGALLWAACADIDVAVRAPAKLVSEHGPLRLSSSDGGVVEAILVAPGDHVAKGQILVRLDPTEPSAAAARDLAERDDLRARLARLDIEAGAAPSRCIGEMAIPEGPLSDASQSVGAERRLLAADCTAESALEASARDRVAEARAALAAARSTEAARAIAAEETARDAATLAALADKDIEPAAESTRARAQAVAAAAAFDAARADVERAAATVAATSEELRSSTRRFRAAAARERAEVAARLAALDAAAPGIAVHANRVLIRAPAPGIVARLFAAGAGESVRPGEPLVEFGPDREPLIAEARVDPRDIAALRTGTMGRLRLTAFDGAVYGFWLARVAFVAPDTDAETPRAKPAYRVRLRLIGGPRGADGRALVLRPGMTGEVAILAGHRTVLSYLMTPLSRLPQSIFAER